MTIATVSVSRFQSAQGPLVRTDGVTATVRIGTEEVFGRLLSDPARLAAEGGAVIRDVA